MKKIYSLIALAMTSFGFAQGTETFDTQTQLTSSYANGNFNGETTGVTISYTHSRNEGLGSSDNYSINNSKGIMLRRINEQSSVSLNIPNGVGTFTFQARKAFTGGSNNRVLSVYVNNEIVYTTPTFGNSGNDTTVHTFSTNINTEGPLTIKIAYPTGTEVGNKQITIDNISWTAYEAEETPVEPVAPTASFDLQDALTITPSLDDASSFFGNAVVTIANLGEGQTASLSLENTENFEIITPEVTDLGNGTHSIQIRFNAEGLAANTYTTNLNVEVASQTTALATLEIVGVVSPALSNNLNTIEGLNIYPNPANDVVTITSAANGVKNVQLFDVTGKQIMNVETSSTINVSSLAKGIYVMKVTEAGKSATSKLVIK